MTSYNVFASDVFSLLSKKNKLKFLDEVYNWKPSNTKQRTSEYLCMKVRELGANSDFGVAVTVRNNKTGELFLLCDTMGILS